MDWRSWCIWTVMFACYVIANTVSVACCLFVLITLIYVILYLTTAGIYLAILLIDIPIWFKLFYVIGTVASVYRISQQLLVTFFLILNFFTGFFILEPLVLFVTDFLLCKYRRRSVQVGSEGNSRWKSVGNTPFIDTWNRRICAVKVCDTDPLLDPFVPRHVSVVHVVETRIWDFFSMWMELNIWRVSMITRHREKLHTAHVMHYGNVYDDSPIQSFESDGVIAIFANRHVGDMFLLYVYDTHTDWSAAYEFSRPWPTDTWDHLRYVAFSCVARFTDEKGSLEGLRIRLIHAEKDAFVSPSAARLVHSVIELREDGQLISQEEITSSKWKWSACSPIRTFDGSSVGFRCRQVAVLYNRHAMKYSRSTYKALLEEGLQFIVEKPFSSRSIYPMVLNPRECIQLLPADGVIYRAQFAASTLGYQAARALLRSNQDLREMNQEQFRRQTGITSMGVHLKQHERINQWPKMIALLGKLRF